MKIGLLFAGQGAQTVGMGKDFYETFSSSKEVFDSYPNIRDLCFYGPKETLDDTRFAQSAILLTSLAIASALDTIKVDYVAGLSLGEYSALTYANALSLEDAVHVTGERGAIMANALPKGTSTMAAVLGLDDKVILDICNQVEGVCEIANYNCPGQIVITGEIDAVTKATSLLQEAGARRVIPLNVSGAFHSSLLNDASKELAKILDKVSIKKPDISVVYNTFGAESDQNVKEILQQQIRSSVKFTQMIEYMISKGVTTFIEIGPGKALSGFVRKTSRDVKVYSIDKVEDVKVLKEELQIG